MATAFTRENTGRGLNAILLVDASKQQFFSLKAMVAAVDEFNGEILSIITKWNGGSSGN